MMRLQDRLSTSVAEAQQAQQELLASKQKIHALEIEKTLAASSEQRLTTSISQVATYTNFVFDTSIHRPRGLKPLVY